MLETHLDFDLVAEERSFELEDLRTQGVEMSFVIPVSSLSMAMQRQHSALTSGIHPHRRLVSEQQQLQPVHASVSKSCKACWGYGFVPGSEPPLETTGWHRRSRCHSCDGSICISTNLNSEYTPIPA